MATIQNAKDVFLQAATPRQIVVTVPSTNVTGQVDGVAASTVKNNAATAAAHASSTGNPHGVSLTQIAGDLDDIADGSTFFRTTANETTGAGRAFSALNSSSEYIKSLKSTQLTVVGSNPSTGWVGDANGIRMYQSSVLKVNIPSSGTPYFSGDISGGANINVTGQGIFKGTSISGTGRHAAILANENGAEQYGIVGYAASGSQYVGVFGDASGKSADGVWGTATLSGKVGVVGTNNTSGGFGLQGSSSSGTALLVSGRMQISSTTLVSNLNADMVDGVHASALCQIVVANSGTCTVSGNGFNLVSTVANVGTLGSSNVLTIRSTSDERLKQDIEPETLGLDFINKLKPVKFKMRANPKVQQHGFIAQDVEKIIKRTDDALFQIHEDGIRGTDYLSLISPIVNSLQQISKELSIIKENLRSSNG